MVSAKDVPAAAELVPPEAEVATDEVVSCGGRGRDCCLRDNFRGAQVRGRDGAVTKVVAAVTKVVAGGREHFI